LTARAGAGPRRTCRRSKVLTNYSSQTGRGLDDMGQQRGRDEQALATATSNRDKLASEIEQLEQRRAQFQGQLAKLTDVMAARNRELAEVGGQFQSALQEMANTQSQLADVRKQLAGPLIPVQQPQQVGSGEQGATQPPAEPQPK
jgi:chromosome segregation ATPase